MQQRRGLRPGEELLVEVQCRVLDSTGTSLPDAGSPVAVGVTNRRVLVWSVPESPLRTSRLLGGVDRARLESATAERRGERVAILLAFDGGARLDVDARAVGHPEQLVWFLTAETPHTEQ